MHSILVTGATGFVGGAVAAELLALNPDASLLFLVRARSVVDAQARLAQSLRRFLPEDALSAYWNRCSVLPGDLTERHSLADPRFDTVTHVIHAAGNTSFRSIRAVRHTNILGTLTLAHRLRRSSCLQRFVHVSTAYICGAPSPALVHETDYPHPGVRHLVEYTASKAECEMLLENTVPELPLVVTRPSIVIGHSRLGCLPSTSIYWYYRTLALLGRTPFAPTTRRDIVPVDYVADALIWLLFRHELRYRCYHISSGFAAAATWQEIADELLVHEAQPNREAIQQVDFATIARERHRLRQCLGAGNEERLLKALELFFRFSTSGVEVFDNRRLLAEGMAAPPCFVSYLPVCAHMPSGRSVYEQLTDEA